MSINNMTIGEFKKLSNIFCGNQSSDCPVEVGKAYLFRTVTHIEVGRVLDVSGKFVTLEEASWIADTGRYHDCLVKGVFKEVEPYPETTTINTDSLINLCSWPHDLPKEQK